MSTNRREFLKRSGGFILAAWAGSTGLAAAAESAAPLPATPPTSADATSLERWLLETGRHQIDPDVYRAVAGGKV